MHIKNEIERVFGNKALDQALYFNHDRALRFELSEGESYIELFTTAYNKACKILDDVFQKNENIYVCLAYYGEDTILGNLSSLKGLDDCQISIEDYEIWEKYDPDYEANRIFVTYKTEQKEIKKILLGVLATELGIKPQIGCTAYFINFTNRIIANPYDDRGMDIIGLRKEIMQEIFNNHKEYLLKANIEEMKKYYEQKI